MKKVLWQEMTGGELVAAAKTTGGVCILPIGCLEKHAEHLPAGTDVLIAAAWAEAAAKIEPAVVFPTQHLGVVNEIKCFPGVIATPTHLLIQLWEVICDEIARNGFKKIILLNGHGGNRFLIYQFVIDMMTSPRDYVLYAPKSLKDPALARKLMESKYEAHAGELETSIIMHLRPDLVREDMIGTLDGRPQRSETPLGADVYTSADWYSLHPWHYAGDARPATADKGRQIFESEVKNLAAIIKAVKADKATPKSLADYYSQFNIVKTYKAPAKKGKGKK